MVSTHKMEAFTQMIDNKFEEVRVSLLNELKAEFETVLECKNNEIVTYIEMEK